MNTMNLEWWELTFWLVAAAIVGIFIGALTATEWARWIEIREHRKRIEENRRWR